MSKKSEEMEKILRYQIKYGKRKNETFFSWLLRKRSINIAFVIIFAVEGIDFADFEIKTGDYL